MALAMRRLWSAWAISLMKSKIMTNNNKKGAVLWFTGLSGAGKSTVADEVYRQLAELGVISERIDGDSIRENLNDELGFSKAGRERNVAIAGYVAKVLSKHGVIVLSSFISPYREQRDILRNKIDGFVEVYVNAPLHVCEERDVKGLYKKARSGEIKNFTGIDDPYEEPLLAELTLNTAEEDLEESADKVIEFLKQNNFIE